ncbi:MAG: hypothetical protein ACOC6B_01715 [Thermodesulfobacteriota bacterium]
MTSIDPPLVDLIDRFLTMPYCFTLQCCYGHFLHAGQRDWKNLKRLPISDTIGTVEYRIAYLALCIQHNNAGISLLKELSGIPAIDPGYIQFGCAEWFWEQQVNSYALQVEPERYRTKDRISVDYQEALHLQRTRDECFAELKRIIANRLRE